MRRFQHFRAPHRHRANFEISVFGTETWKRYFELSVTVVYQNVAHFRHFSAKLKSNFSRCGCYFVFCTFRVDLSYLRRIWGPHNLHHTYNLLQFDKMLGNFYAPHALKCLTYHTLREKCVFSINGIWAPRDMSDFIGLFSTLWDTRITRRTPEESHVGWQWDIWENNQKHRFFLFVCFFF